MDAEIPKSSLTNASRLPKMSSSTGATTPPNDLRFEESSDAAPATHADPRQDNPAVRTPPAMTCLPGELLTPPVTPEKAVIKPASATVDALGIYHRKDEPRILAKWTREKDEEGACLTPGRPSKAIRRYYGHFQTIEKLGTGAWSTVYSATELPSRPISNTNLPPSPPTSPQTHNKPGERRAQLLAVKIPSRRDAHKILEEEARILTYLSSHSASEQHVVPFHGLDEVHQAIVLSAARMNLQDYIHMNQGKKPTMATRCDPILGMDIWQQLAQELIEGLDFLHGQGCIHGDIKPANILLFDKQGTETHAVDAGKDHDGDNSNRFAFLFCDFSSSHITNTENTSPPAPVTAVTPDFTSPELFSLLARSPATAIPSPSSDVFALGVTLLVSSTGESPYSCGQIEMQKLSMRKQGQPLYFAQMCSQASRCRKSSIVERLVKAAVEKDVEKRIKVADWKDMVKDEIRKTG